MEEIKIIDGKKYKLIDECHCKKEKPKHKALYKEPEWLKGHKLEKDFRHLLDHYNGLDDGPALPTDFDCDNFEYWDTLDFDWDDDYLYPAIFDGEISNDFLKEFKNGLDWNYISEHILAEYIDRDFVNLFYKHLNWRSLLERDNINLEEVLSPVCDKIFNKDFPKLLAEDDEMNLQLLIGDFINEILYFCKDKV